MKLGLVLFVAMSGLGGCASGARMVRTDARGGELETWGPVVPAQTHMRALLVEHCQGRFAVAEQGEASNGHDRLTFSCLQPASQPQLAYPAAVQAAERESMAVVTPVVTPELRSAQ